MSSMRLRIVAGIVVGLGVLLGIAGVVLAREIDRRLQAELDAGLLARESSLEALTELEGKQVVLELPDRFMPQFGEDVSFQLWLDDGRVLARSAGVMGRGLPRTAGGGERPEYRDVRLPDGRRGRLLQRTFQVTAEEYTDASGRSRFRPAATQRAVTAVVVASREHLDAFQRRLHLLIAAGGLALMLVAALLVMAVTAAGLAPLEELSAQVSRQEAGRLGEEVRLARPLPRELAPLVARLNELFGRLGDAFRRERAFSSNVAHELRTPLAELRTTVEVALRFDRQADQLRGALQEVHAAGLRLERLVVQLLALARAEAEMLRVERLPLQLRPAVQDAWRALRGEAERREVRLDLDMPGEPVVVSDADKLHQVLLNLLENAVSHGPEHGRVVARSRAMSGARVELAISNPAPRLSREDLEQMTDPLWRDDGAPGDGAHLGLGLSLVTAYSALLDIGLAFDLGEEGVLTASLVLPSPAHGGKTDDVVSAEG